MILNRIMKISFRIVLAIFICSVFWSRNSMAQQDSTQISQSFLDMGMEIFDFEHRKQAREIFEQAVSYDPGNARALFMLGKSIMMTVHKEESLPYFLLAHDLDSKVDEEILYLIGQGYHYSEDFEAGIEYYNRYIDYLWATMDSGKYQKLREVDKKIFECRNGILYKAYPVDVDIMNLGEKINTEYPDYAPVVSGDESILLFTSRRPHELNPNMAEDFEYYEDIYISHLKDGKYEKAENIGKPVNTKYHNATIGISSDGKELIIYSDLNGGDIYETFLQDDGSWTEPVSLRGGINTQYHENSAAISADRQVLYFVSDRPGGLGGMDIYRAEKGRGGEWTNITNLGDHINTFFDEDAVFISADGSHLYFSSFGHYGMGDLDIYRSEWDEDKQEWGEPMNLGYPINSTENDIYFVLSADETTGYFSSVKFHSMGEQDIYSVDMTRFEPVDIRKKYQVKEVQEQLLPPVTLDIEVAPSTGDMPDSLEVRISAPNGKNYVGESVGNGKYRFILPASLDSAFFQARVEFVAKKPDAVPVVAEVKEVTYNEPLKTKERETVPVVKMEAAQYLMNLFFDIESSQPVSVTELDYILLMLSGSSDLKVEVIGHADNTGNADFNEQLGLARANFIKDYLVKNGIDQSRITTLSMGDTSPIADNSQLSGRRLNRRAEVRFVE